MNQQSKLEIIDKDGWQKFYPLEKNIVYIGSQRRGEDDIILEQQHGGGVAPLHAQLIASNSNNSGYKLVNLANEDILLRSADEDQTLPPRAVINLIDGETLILGEFTLVFHAGQAYPGGFGGRSGNDCIGLSLSLPRPRLAPHQTLKGAVTVRNLGDQASAQFEVGLDGLEPDYYHIEPGPILPAGAEKEVFFYLYHRGDKPLAGDWRITFRATAPRAYPGEQATVSQVIQIVPFYHHSLKLRSPAEVGASAPAEEDPPAAKTPPVPQAAETATQEEDLWTAPPQAAVEPSPQDKVEAGALPQLEKEEIPEAKAGKKWWARLVRLLPVYRRQAPALPPDSAQTGQVPPVAGEAATKAEVGIPTQAGEQPAPEAQAGVPTPVEAEPLPLAEVDVPLPAEIKAEESPPAEAGLLPLAQVEQIPPAQASLPRPEAGRVPQPAAEEPLPPTEADTWPQQMAAEQLPEAEASPPPPVAEAPAPEARPDAPSQAEDLGLSKEETGLPSAPAETEQISAVEVDVPPEAEDLWAAEAEQAPAIEADVPAEAEDLWAAGVEVDTPPVQAGVEEAEDLWTSSPETSPTAQVEKKQALRLKASPPPAAAEQVPEVETDRLREAEDLWASEAESETK